MSLDIRVNRPPLKPAPGPDDRPERIKPPQAQVRKPAKVKPTASGDKKEVLSQPPPPVYGKRPKRTGRWLWWLLLLLLVLALGYLVFLIWQEGKDEPVEEIDKSPVVSTFNQPTNSQLTKPPPEQTEKISSSSILGSSLNDLNEGFTKTIAENDSSATSSEKILSLQKALADLTSLYGRYIKYYNDLEAKVSAVTSTGELVSYSDNVGNKLDQAKVELDIAKFALISDDISDIASNTVTEAVASLQNVFASLSAATDSLALLEQGLLVGESEIDTSMATGSVTTTVPIATTTASTTP